MVLQSRADFRGNSLFRKRYARLSPRWTINACRPRITASTSESRDAWSREFVNVAGTVADQHAPKELHEQRPVFHILGANFRTALAEAERLGMDQHFAALTQSLAAYALNERDFQGASALLAPLAEQCESKGNDEVLAATYHQLGMIAEEQRDFAAAEQWYRKALAIFEKQGNEHLAAMGYGQLGNLARLQEHYEQAGQWFLKALGVFRRSDPHNAQKTVRNFLVVYQQADESTRKKVQAMWDAAGLGPLPEPE